MATDKAVVSTDTSYSRIWDNPTRLYSQTSMGTTQPDLSPITTGSGLGTQSNFSEFDNSTALPDHWEDYLSAKLWEIVPPVVLLIGLTGNVLVMAVLRVMKFTQVVALFFFFILAVADSSVLTVVLLHYWLRETFSVDMRLLSEPGCKIMMFLTYYTMHLSSWTLTAVTVERFLVIRFSLRARSLVTMTRAKIAILLIACALAVTDGYLLFTQRIADGSCGSAEGDPIFFFDEHVFVFIDMLVLSVLPFSVMLLCNIVIIREVRGNISRHKNLGPSDQNCNKEQGSPSVSSITLMLLAVNLYFLITTIPISAYFIIDTFISPGLEAGGSGEAKMNLAWTLCYLLQFTNYGLNFYIYVARGRRFRAAFWKLFRRNPDRDDSVISRRLTFGDVTDDVSVVRRGTVTEGVHLLRRGTVMEAISNLRRGTVADCGNNKRQATFGEGISTISVDDINKI